MKPSAAKGAAAKIHIHDTVSVPTYGPSRKYTPTATVHAKTEKMNCRSVSPKNILAAKGEIENIVLSSDADVIIIDPEREYSALVKALGGEIINISATSPSHINAMDMNKEYGDGANPVILKSEFIMSLCEQLIGGNNLGAKQKATL